MNLLNNRYHLQSIIGQGGMGRVYLARDMTNNQLVAVKECFVASGKEQQSLIERIKREYYFMTQIKHPNVVSGIDFFCIQNKYFIVMEYADGMTLKTFIQTRKHSISLDKQLQIAAEICDAVAILHQHNIIHRDLKPHNIILTTDSYTPKLLDLGIAKMVHPDVQTITMLGSIIGTPEYMSPEQFDCNVFYCSDIFALGIILYQFFSWMEHSPFTGDSLISTMNKVGSMELPPLHSIYQNQNFPEKNDHLLYISQVLKRALQKNPQKRFLSMIDFKNALIATPTTIKKIKRKRKQKPQNNNAKYQNTILILSLLTTSIAFLLFYQEFSETFEENPKAPEIKIEKQETINLNENNTVKETNLKLYYEKAHEYYISQDYEKALENYGLIIAITNEDPIAYSKIGEIYGKIKDYEKALDHYTKSVDLGFENAKMYQEIGNIYCHLGNHSKVVENFSESLKIDSENIELYDHRSEHYIDLEEYEKAIEDCNIVINKQPDNIASYQRRSYSYTELEEYKKAKKDLNKILQIDPGNAKAYNDKGLVLYYQERYDAAIENYNKAIALNFINDTIYYDRGDCYCKLGEGQKAIDDFSTAIQINPNNSYAYSHRAEHYMTMKEFEKSIADCNKALEFDTEDISAYGIRGSCYGAIGEYEKALADYNTIIKFSPMHDLAYSSRGNIYNSLGNYQQAIHDWNKAIEINSYNEAELRELIDKAKILLDNNNK